MRVFAPEPWRWINVGCAVLAAAVPLGLLAGLAHVLGRVVPGGTPAGAGIVTALVAILALWLWRSGVRDWREAKTRYCSWRCPHCGTAYAIRSRRQVCPWRRRVYRPSGRGIAHDWSHGVHLACEACGKAGTFNGDGAPDPGPPRDDPTVLGVGGDSWPAPPIVEVTRYR